jgi:hypothetical protein
LYLLSLLSKNSHRKWKGKQDPILSRVARKVFLELVTSKLRLKDAKKHLGTAFQAEVLRW